MHGIGVAAEVTGGRRRRAGRWPRTRDGRARGRRADARRRATPARSHAPASEPPASEPPRPDASPGTRHDRRSAAATEPAGDLLVATGCTKRFGGLVAVNDIDFTIPRGGDRQPDRAERRRQDDVLQHDHRACTSRPRGRSRSTARTSPAASRTRSSASGIARTFQNIRLFGNMTAEDNVLVGLHHRLKGRWFGGDPASRRRSSARRSEAHARAQELLDLVGLEQRRDDARPEPAVRRPAPAGDRAGARDRARSCCCSTSRRPG